MKIEGNGMANNNKVITHQNCISDVLFNILYFLTSFPAKYTEEVLSWCVKQTNHRLVTCIIICENKQTPESIMPRQRRLTVDTDNFYG